MTAIWFILAFMTGLAVLSLLWPMSRRTRAVAGSPEGDALATQTGFYEDQLREIDRDLARGLIAPAEAEAARTEAARRLLRANRDGGPKAAGGIAEPALRQRRAASAFALSTIPLVALIAYGIYGSPHLPAQTAAERQAGRTGDQDLLKAVGQIEARLASDPKDGRGWQVLAPVYMRMGRFDDAVRAYEMANRILGETPDRLSDLGEAMVAAGNGAISPESRAVFERAAGLDPAAPKPRFYLARAAELSGDVPGAVDRLTQMIESAPADASWLPLVRENLARLKGEPAPSSPAATAAVPPSTSPPAASPQAMPPEARDAAIRGMVDGLDQRLAAKGGTAEEWVRLLRSYGVLGEREKAVAALARARAGLAQDADGLARVEALANELDLAKPAPPGRPSPEKASPANGAPGKASQAPGAPAANADTEAAIAAVKAMPAAERDAAIRGMVAALDRRLAAKGGSLDDWLRLVRSYAALGERKQAAQALDRARMALSPDPSSVGRLDLLAKELELHGSEPRQATTP
ncbi:cytochrome C [Methylobacterium sp. Leaf399]|uniref:c-type cytochrome biogenesis protein CcmI n=1 Tax=unclassified Methylobacterium TaxID=2615210 RepID=UPI0006F1E806|nr:MULTISPECIES: c-type cytochrome biogenesis protein CcmI [unclassified Methylobacterium]KQP61705.1 cytochrome C [Methylobacterium sp. Leaf108]KQT19973.1 cytochrome C [Methylobacterium sp. Leaf399]